MKTFKIIIFSALIVFHLATVIVISIGKNDLNFLFDLFKQMDLLQYGSIFGLILFLVVIGLFQVQERATKKLTEKHEQEINQIKAKLYDKKESEASQKEKTPVAETATTNTTESTTTKQEEGDKTKPED